MKKYTCLLLLLFSGYLSAQSTYKPMLEGRPLWFQDFIGPGSYFTQLIGSAPDTFPDGKIYHRIFTEDRRRSLTFPIGYLYEDTTSRQIFFYERDQNDSLLISTEILLYDFSLQVGEEVIVPDIDYNRIDTLVLDSINNNIPNAQWNPGNLFTHDSVKVFYFTTSSTVWGNNTSAWVEGIGSLTGLLNPSVPINSNESLICVHRYDTLAFRPYADTCDLTLVSIDESLDKNKLKVKIIRFEDQLSLELEEALSTQAELRIINLNGQVLLRQKLTPIREEFKIDIRRYPPGIYYLSILDGGAFYHGSFIK